MPRLPARVFLPSGRVARLSDEAARRAAAQARAPDIQPGGCMEALTLLEAEDVTRDGDGAPLDVRGLSLRDFHVLRALLLRAGVQKEETAELPCENCGEAFRVAPSSLLEIAPFVDGELDDPELDAPFDHDAAHVIPAIRVGAELARSVRVAARTVEEALPLFRAESAPARITPAIVIAMGITTLGRERRASAIAKALGEAPPEAYQSVADLLYEAHYPARLGAVHRCATCGARSDLDVPWRREIPYEIGEPRKARRDFPDLDAFEAMVASAADRIYRARGVRNIDLFVDDDVPACDDGGEPLLGCYTPGGTDPTLGMPRPPEIRLFYRTFQAEHRRDRSFDVAAEIDETIDHEITHHLHHLAGDDPLDDEEHAQIEEEALRRIGKREATRRAGKGVASELAGFVRTTWPLFVIAFVATYFTFCR
ncbi:hypothetical protein [Polyangium spumosum]|uniref:hypothetical protein n=1 Tax=Polyangium spumosum TaxID=889282 RepID=UPI0030843B7F